MKYKVFTILFLFIIGVFAFTHQASAAITSGNYTLKLAGGDYSTWAAFWDDLGNLTGNITLTVDASAFSEDTAPASVLESLGGHTLHVLPASFPTTTDGSTGARFTCNYIDMVLDLQTEGSGTVIIEGMVIIEGTSEPDKFIYTINVSSAFTLIIRRNIVKGCYTAISMTDSTIQDFQIYNNIFYDVAKYGLYLTYDATSAIVANNTLVHSGDDNVYAGDEELNFKNNLSYGATNACWLNIELLTNGYNNADSDSTGEDADWGGTGSNNVPGIADPFNDLANDDWTITAEGVIGTAGLDLSTDFTTDFFGTTRSNWTIGAVEYTVAANSAPTISSATDYPDPEKVGNTITFSVDWNDADTEGIKMLICKDSNLTVGANPSCNAGQWCSNDDNYDSADPITCTYTVQSGDIGSNNYSAFVCDNEPECSSATSSTFTVEAVTTPSLRFDGGVHFKGGTIFK